MRHPHNRGLAWNYLVGLEEARGEWIWTLSDDDPVSPQALEQILERTRTSGAGVVQGASVLHAQPVRRHHAPGTWLADPVHMGHILFAPTYVYRNDAVRPHLRVFADGIHSFAPHTFLILHLLDRGLVDLETVPEIWLESVGEAQWDPLWFMDRIPALLDATATEATRRRLALLLWDQMHDWFLHYTLRRETPSEERMRTWIRSAGRSSGRLAREAGCGARLGLWMGRLVRRGPDRFVRSRARKRIWLGLLRGIGPGPATELWKIRAARWKGKPA